MRVSTQPYRIVRVVIGLLFIFSGLVKANDPLGLAYKMQEFFEIWQQDGFLPGLMQSLSQYALAFSVLMIAFEIIAGVAVLLAWRMRLVSWLLLLLILFFTFLTGYAYLSGKFRSCGCFGDCIPITPLVSFIKDIALTALILWLFVKRHRFTSTHNRRSNIILGITTVFSFALQWYVLTYLPIADCLPYRKGNNLLEQRKIPAGAIPDSTVITFVYQRQGKEVEFTADRFPDDFDDSLYTFVRRYDKLVRKGNAEPAIKDFVLKTREGTDVTDSVLTIKGYSLLLFTKTVSPQGKWIAGMNALTKQAAERNIPLFAASSDAASVESIFAASAPNLRILDCDVVAVKTAARTNPTLYLLKDGTVIDKWSYAQFDRARAQLLSRLP